jgi:DNA polymerase III epsilon subunit-like protein
MLVFVDCEAYGGSPVTGQLTEFGAVAYPKLDTFHGVIVKSEPDPSNPAVPLPAGPVDPRHATKVFENFAEWLSEVGHGERPVFVSDNVAFDWQWINCGFHQYLGYNPFGHSGRRISDYYAGLRGDWSITQKWKHLRITKHDHNPVHDALGNAEAFRRIQEGER